jgi:hypothetical protein
MIKIGLEEKLPCIACTGLLGLMFREVDIMWRSFYVALLVAPKNMPYSGTVSVNCARIKQFLFIWGFAAKSSHALLFGCFKDKHFVTK